MRTPPPPPPARPKEPSPYAGVSWVRPEVAAMIPFWRRIDAALEGQAAVKALREQVLPRPNASDTSEENMTRYEQYLRRAMYYNVPGRTLQGMAGYVFAKEPVAELPDTLKPLEKNVDGSGVTLNQQAKDTFRKVMSKGRAGLLVDFPKRETPATQADINEGKASPRIVLYSPESMINYDFTDESETELSLLVLHEERMVPIQGNRFEKKLITQYRVLMKTDVGVEFWVVRQGKAPDEYTLTDEGLITGQDGEPLQVIPFTFIGAQNNNPAIDPPPLLDLVEMALSHFCNSADYEESCFIVGQPTPYFTGLTKQWVDEVLEGEIEIGARAAVLLPLGAAAGLLQASPNSLPFEAMEKKEKQMIAIGAKLVEERKVQRTATEAGLDHASDASALVTAANNVFLGYSKALEHCALFMPGGKAEISFELAESLTKDNIEAPQAVAIMELWNNGLLGYEEVRWKLKQAGLAFLEDEVVKTEGEERRAEQEEAEIRKTAAKGAGPEGKGASRSEVKKPPVKKTPAQK